MRATLAFLPAVFLTLALFYLMHFMISGRGQRLTPDQDYGVVDFVHVQPTPEKTHRDRPARPPPERPLAAAGSPSLPRLATQPLPKPEQPPLSADVPRAGTVALGAPPPLRSLVGSVPKPRVARAPTAPPGPPPQAPSPPDVASQPVRPDAPRLAGGGSAASVGGLEGAQTALPGLDGAGDGEVVALFRLEPDYPRKAAMAGTEGWVKLGFTINERGTVTDAVVVDSSPSRIFDRSALRAIRKWRFKPMVANGKTVPRRATQVFEFKLAGS